MFRISEKLPFAVKTSKFRGYEIANRAGIHPATLSKLLWEIKIIKPDDPRVVAVGKVLGLNPAECFEKLVDEVPSGNQSN